MQATPERPLHAGAPAPAARTPLPANAGRRTLPALPASSVSVSVSGPPVATRVASWVASRATAWATCRVAPLVPPWGRSAVRCLLLAAVLAAAPGAPLHAQASEPSRGRLLYQTHCVACHNSQMHWRDRRIARDWPGLVEQVRAWQARASLGWSEGDIVEVARHLNDTIYRFPRPLARSAQRPRPNA